MAEALNVEQVLQGIFEDFSEVSNEESEEKERRDLAEDGGGDVPMHENMDAIVYLKTRAIYPRKLFINESQIWLTAIRRRLSGRRSIQQPFTGVVRRDIPLEVFNVLVPLVGKLGLGRPTAMVEKSRKAVVIAFSDLASTTRFLSTLSAVATEELVETYMRKELKGRKSGSKVELLVSEDKQFSLIYHFKKGQMEIFFILASGTVMVSRSIISWYFIANFF